MVDGLPYKVFLNCRVSPEFFEFLIMMAIFEGIQNGFKVDENSKQIDAEEKLDELIACGVWDWKNEVRERKVLNGINFDVERYRKELEYMIRMKGGWGYYE